MSNEDVKKNIEIEISTTHFQFLLDIIKDDEIKSELNRNLSRAENKQKYKIFLTRESCEKALDAISNALMEQGVSPRGEINNIGLIIEEIIDIFNGKLYS